MGVKIIILFSSPYESEEQFLAWVTYFIRKDVTLPFCPCSPGNKRCTYVTNLLTPSKEEVIRMKGNS